jgi:hypothetical protein
MLVPLRDELEFGVLTLLAASLSEITLPAELNGGWLLAVDEITDLAPVPAGV